MYNGAKNDTRIIYVSKGNDPETIDQTEDYIQNFDGVPVDILNGKELRGSYFIYKENTTFTTREDPGTPPNEWRVDIVDSGIGISPVGIAEVMANPGGLVLDNIIVGGMSGLYVFSGSYSHMPLSYKLQGLLDSYSRGDIKYLRMAVDPIKRRLFVHVGDPSTGADGVRHLYVGDYYRGLDPQNIRWSEWVFTIPPRDTPVVVDTLAFSIDPNNASANRPNMTVVINDTHNILYEIREDLVPAWDFEDYSDTSEGLPIAWAFETGFTANQNGYLFTFTNILLRMILKIVTPTIDPTTVSVTITPMDTTTSGTPNTTKTIEAAPAKLYNFHLGDYVAEKIRVRVSGTNAMFLNKLVLWVSEKGKTRPKD
jgi:hypothetical protein